MLPSRTNEAVSRPLGYRPEPCFAPFGSLLGPPALGDVLQDYETSRQISTAVPPRREDQQVGAPDSILNKPGPLDESEQALMREHPMIGGRIVASIEGLDHLAPVVQAEHERWDGRGYPDGLLGERKPLGSRVVFACDAFHARRSTGHSGKRWAPGRRWRRRRGTRARSSAFAPCVRRSTSAPPSTRSRRYSDSKWPIRQVWWVYVLLLRHLGRGPNLGSSLPLVRPRAIVASHRAVSLGAVRPVRTSSARTVPSHDAPTSRRSYDRRARVSRRSARRNRVYHEPIRGSGGTVGSWAYI